MGIPEKCQMLEGRDMLEATTHTRGYGQQLFEKSWSVDPSSSSVKDLENLYSAVVCEQFKGNA